MSETPRTPAHTPPQTLPTPAGGLAAISKYNPHLWSPEQLRAIFVARQNELADLLATLRNTPPDTVGQHVLLVGARGMGKSTLMQRLALAVDDDAELTTQWLALRFPEEQYTVSALNQFWANVLDALADALERRGTDLRTTQALDDEAERIADLPVAEQTAAYLKTIADCAQTRGQRLLLLVDNTDVLLSNIGKDAQWALRDVLQTQRHLLWVGGSYQSLEAHSEYHDAFLDFFRVLELRPLKLQDMQAALLALAQTFGGAAAHAQMQTTLRTQPERLATLRQLSGGNPRTTVMLYTLLAGGQAGQVRSDLEVLLDDMTPLYKSRLDNLADMQRKLLAHILEHWSPIAMGELEKVSQIKASTISGQLKRLELEGLIERTALHGTTRSGYQVTERFFNIWYLMRMSPRRRRSHLLWLVEFMRLWFSPDELQHMAHSRMGEPQRRRAGKHLHELEYDHALAEALPPESSERHQLRWGILKQLREQRESLSALFDLDGADQDFKGADDYLRRFEAAREALRQCPHAKTEEERTQWVEAVMGSLNWSLGEKTRVADKAASLSRLQFDEIHRIIAKETTRWTERLGGEAAQVLRQAVLDTDFFPDMPNSRLAYEQIRACFGHSVQATEFACELKLARQADEWTYKTLCWAAQQFPTVLHFAHERAWLLHHQLKRYAEAEAAYRQAIALDEKNAAPWSNLGSLLQDHLGRYTEAEAAYRQAIALDEKDAKPWNWLGHLLQDHLGRYAEAEAAYRQAIALDEKDATPWNNLGNLLQDHLGRYAEAEAAYRQAIALDEKDAYPVANLSRLLWQQGCRTEGIECFKQTLDLSQTDELELRLQAHLALGNRQLALDALNDMAQLAQQGNNEMFDRLKEQVWECSELGLGETLADWMRESPHALFLQPFVQALYELAGVGHKLQDLPQEVQQMADAVVRMGVERRNKASAVKASSSAQAIAESGRAASGGPT
ncbi:MAG: tetratricopeptide repeat protein [Hydrogenophaga sp.]|nr:tetratricopeptide repeat protein [Hydrogenophaga sp.]